MSALVGIVLGSDSDLPLMKDAVQTLEKFGIPYELNISSAHRAPDKTAAYAKSAASRGLKVIIAAAGLAAHLPGVLAAHTVLPVIGVPVKSGALNGVDALYAIAQMPPGVPVASVAVNGAKNAAILAAQMIALTDASLQQQLYRFKEHLAAEVEEKDARLKEFGVDGYLNAK
ncbi:5-(carboxyamino)imidazole ribonucleotide mutase [Desulforamulus hydrothermalis]|uniref:N5-carboxyaminoimidazole ribonucleotide mutase n=1 Tax=Desulforamulus hydrothermalis Lam5 = DSM 18033 TaxID=1121428 RepID=K8E0S3_9FIRM|nr:5-(carboxyamino)imidazole ribonucleotide mutase [Desulforamulus hydrothermalis]CCO09222.1 N5-carboxyaminoimidazole ribonucleotide mutase [Desulforamulus hydrothermalis Lam5 = DSM 18033]SHH06193.1 5-(carboxyamino)imidazole ribonucleotide mutase [Desulforamulus hydrothermalis Lam5 = DSM 18033]